MSSVISVERLSKDFHVRKKGPGLLGGLRAFLTRPTTVHAVKNISFSVKKGELVGFIGPNGAGKSTTIKMLSGILTPTKGSLRVLGFNPQEDRRNLSYQLGTIFGQRQQLLYHLPAIDTFNLFSKIYEIPDLEYQTRLAHLTRVFDIGEYLHTPVRKLSLGQRMRCELVASLLHQPPVLFLDEPTIGMDILAKKSMRALIKEINEQEKTTILLTSHDLDDIEELCHRVIVINKGTILYDGSVEKLRRRLPHKVLKLTFDHPTTKLPCVAHVRVLRRSPLEVVLQVDKAKAPISKVLSTYLSACHIADIVIEDPPIEEVVERLYA